MLGAAKEDSQEGFEVKMQRIEHCEWNDLCVLTAYSVHLSSLEPELIPLCPSQFCHPRNGTEVTWLI